MKGSGLGPSEAAIVNSALWSAAGDALGWITELSRGLAGVVRRTGEKRVIRPVSWRRRVGGRGGPTVELPAGTYSDDTQLRLAVGRSIRGDGSFDVETFAKIEITVWPTYALGAGLGTKAAAASLTRRKVNWFSNFFETGRQRYVHAGGNGAAMRIQPHVWSSAGDMNALMVDVLRDALVTHGHPHGFCGAVFHALCLAGTLSDRRLPEFAECKEYAKLFLELEPLVARDPQLSVFWRGYWEQASGKSLGDAMALMWQEASRDIERVEQQVESSGGNEQEIYHSILLELGCLDPRYRGSGFKTALAALSLARLFPPTRMEKCLETAANELDSDTDTIATMAGALLGTIAEADIDWPIQDRSYITGEAVRLFAISRGETQDSFLYPDLSIWDPPSRQNASIGLFEDELALVGLGRLSKISEEYESSQGIWQWLNLPFGQSILAKRRHEGEARVAASQLPRNVTIGGLGRNRKVVSEGLDKQQGRLPLRQERATSTHPEVGKGQVPIEVEPKVERAVRHQEQGTVDSWTREVISRNFDDEVMGRMLNRCIDQSQSVEAAIGFASIIAKARLARIRRQK